MAKTVAVKKGDTLSGIAKANGVSLKALLEANPQIKNANAIVPGQKIAIPDTAVTAAESNKKLSVDPAKNVMSGPGDFRQREAAADLKVQDGVKIPALDETPKADTLYKNLPQDTLSEEELAAKFSIAASILNQDESLKKVLNQILAKKVTDPSLQMAMLKETDWFKNNTDDWRKYQFYKDSNPATFTADLQTNAEAIVRKYHAMGIKIDAQTAIKLAQQAMMKSANVNGTIVNYNENYFNQLMADSIDFSKKRVLPNGKIVYDFNGKTETIAQTLYKTAWDYGYQASVSNAGFSNWMEKNIKGLIAGTINPEDVDNELQDRARSMFPGLANQINQGLTLRQAADPWINALANEWEEDPMSLDLNDDFLYRVLNYQDEKGNVSPMSLYQAKVMARRSPKWQYTGKAKEEYTNIGQKILQDFGFLGQQMPLIDNLIDAGIELPAVKAEADAAAAGNTFSIADWRAGEEASMGDYTPTTSYINTDEQDMMEAKRMLAASGSLGQFETKEDPNKILLDQINALTDQVNKNTKKISSGKVSAKVASSSIDDTIAKLLEILSAAASGGDLFGGSGGSGGSGGAGGGGGRSVVGVVTRRKTGGIVQTVQIWSDGTETVIDEYKDNSARDSVMAMFQNLGLGDEFLNSLMGTIDKVYADNIAPTDAQILNSIYSSEAYKKRFAGNEIIRQRMASGKGTPGDRLLTPAEYIKTEAAYRELMSEAGLPTGFYDQQEDFAKFIAELGTSVAEISERVNIAKAALQNADSFIKDSLKTYYGWSEGDMVAYLLDSERAFDAINSRFKYTTTQLKEAYTEAEIGGSALRAGIEGGITKQFAEEISKAGKASQAEQTFQTAARQQADYRRLMGLFGEKTTNEDLAREALGLAGGAEIGIKAKRLASKERARFETRSAVDRTSLGPRLKTPDV